MTAKTCEDLITTVNREWLSANRTVFIEANFPVERILDELISSSQGSLFNPTGDQYQVVCAQPASRDKVRALLDALTISLHENAIHLFKAALERRCKAVLAKCSQPRDDLMFLRHHLDKLYLHDDDDENPFGWLDTQGDQPSQYYLNTCVLEKADAEKLMSSRNATSAKEQQRRDFLYSRPHKSQLVPVETLFSQCQSKDEETPQSPPRKRKKLSASASDVESTSSVETSPEGQRFPFSSAKRVGLYAAAGSGKTCCCVKMTSLHACGELWPHFRVVLFWRLRDPAVRKAEEFWQLILALLPDWSEEQCRQSASALLATNGRGILIVLDGIDEFAAKQTAFVRLLLARQELQQANLFVTSRPCALAKKYFQSYDLNLEMLGFTERQVSEFIHTRLGELAPMLNAFLEDNPRMASLMPVPLLALFVCEVFRITPIRPPKTRTKLYSLLIALLVRRAADEGRIFIPDDELDDAMGACDFREFQGKARSLLIQLSNLAWLAHQDDCITFDSQLVKQAKCSDEALRLGVVTSKSGRTSAQYSFLHLTFQEYLVAFAITHRIKCKRLDSADVQQSNPAPQYGRTEASATGSGVQPSHPPLRQQIDELPQAERRYTAQTEHERALSDLMADLVYRNHHRVILQFLAGLLTDDLHSVFWMSLNQWLHSVRTNTNSCAEETWRFESEEQANSSHRLLTCFECLKEAAGDEDVAILRELQLPEIVLLHPTTASDISVLAKALRRTTDVKVLRLAFDEMNQGSDELHPPTRAYKQTMSAMMLLVAALKKGSGVHTLRLYGLGRVPLYGEVCTVLRQVVQCRSLMTLEVSHCISADSEIAGLAEGLKEQTQLAMLNLSNNSIGDEGAHALALALQSNHTLTMLQLGWNRIGDEGARELAISLQSNHTLTQVYFSWNTISNEGARELAVTLQSNHTLTQLHLGWNSIGDEGACQLAVALQSNHTLTQLKLHGNRISDVGAREIAVALQSNHTLTQLHLGWNRIGDEGVRELAGALQLNSTLKQLHLVDNRIGDKGMREIAVALQSNHSLTQLHLSWNRIGDEGVRDLAVALQSSHTLTQMDLTDNRIGDEGARDLAVALQSSHTLTQLDLTDNRIGDKGARELAVALQSNHTLTQLDLKDNRIGDEGARELAVALQSNHTLTQLDLADNRIGDEGARELAVALQSNRMLTQLDLKDNRIGDEGARELAVALRSDHSLTELDLRGNNYGDSSRNCLLELVQIEKHLV